MAVTGVSFDHLGRVIAIYFDGDGDNLSEEIQQISAHNLNFGLSPDETPDARKRDEILSRLQPVKDEMDQHSDMAAVTPGFLPSDEVSAYRTRDFELRKGQVVGGLVATDIYSEESVLNNISTWFNDHPDWEGRKGRIIVEMRRV